MRVTEVEVLAVIREAVKLRGCRVPGCGRVIHSYGYCVSHATRYRVHGDPQADKPLRRARYDGEPCAVAGCGSRAIARGWCKTHYNQWHVRGQRESP